MSGRDQMTSKKSIEEPSKSTSGKDGLVFQFQSVDSDSSDFQKSADPEFLFVISPSPILWMNELQSHNAHLSPWTIYRELGIRSRQRGTSTLKGYDWPGSILLPSAVVATLLEKEKILTPDHWNLPINLLSRFVAVLHAWQIERTIFSFSGLAREIVANSLVSMRLTSQLFSLIPAHCIYIDFKAVEFPVHPSMSGFFAGLNVDDEGRFELIIAEDHLSHVRVRRLPLRGQTVDQLATQILARARMTETDLQLEDTTWFVDNALHASLSAIMMVCSSHSNSRHVMDGVSDPEGHGLWTKWQIDRPFTDNLFKLHSKALQRDPFSPIVVVAEWVEPPDGQMANLRCSMGTGAQWSNTTGMQKILKGLPPHDQKTN